MIKPDAIILWIGAVDTERDYTITTPSAKEALEFLKRYDHEGSTVGMDVYTIVDDEASVESFEDPEKTYRYLEEHV